MVERVVALVSRVQGTYEFEVQPLREYFAACHLYYTAPHSSPGKERPGSKPDRFDALARNFYWLNVTRFYAGCYSKGELPSLVERLQELTKDNGFRTIGYPRTLGASLLADWVFTQNPRSVQQVVELILDGVGLRYVLAPLVSARRRASGSVLVLPPKCGREELVKRCFEMLHKNPPGDTSDALLEVVRANSEGNADLTAAWIEQYERATDDPGRLKWLDHGVDLGVVSILDIHRLRDLLGTLTNETDLLNILFRARRLDYLQCSEVLFDKMVSGILSHNVSPQPLRRIESALDALSQAVDPRRYAFAFRDRQPTALAQLLERRHLAASLTWSPHIATGTEPFKNHDLCVQLARVADEESQRSTIEWASDLGPWERIIELGRSLFGDRWAFYYLANVGAGIRSSAVKCNEFSDLLDHSQPLSRRTRYARLRSGAHHWWKGQLEAARTNEEQMFVALVALTWVKPATLLAIWEQIDPIVAALDSKTWRELYVGVRRAFLWAQPDGWKEELDISSLPQGLTARFAELFSDRVDLKSAHLIYARYVKGTADEDPVALEVTQREALDLERFGTAEWKPNLELIRRCYGLGGVFEPFALYRHARVPSESTAVPLSIAREITRAPNHYPSFLVALAEERCREDVASRVVAVADVAKQEKWFAEH